jgi:hypothetical protein
MYDASTINYMILYRFLSTEFSVESENVKWVYYEHLWYSVPEICV